jgi:hypothetical protein
MGDMPLLSAARKPSKVIKIWMSQKLRDVSLSLKMEQLTLKHFMVACATFEYLFLLVYDKFCFLISPHTDAKHTHIGTQGLLIVRVYCKCPASTPTACPFSAPAVS